MCQVQKTTQTFFFEMRWMSKRFWLTACTFLQEGRTGNTTTQRNKSRSGRSCFNFVKREPVVKEPDVENGTPALIADLSARGVWDRQPAASFDIRVTDSDAPSYQNRNPMNVLKTAEIEKKNKYGPACEEKHMSFTALVTSIDGVLAPEFTFFLKRLADGLASKWDRPYSHVMCWVRCRIPFAILRAINICIRGTRSKWRSLGIEDGYPIGMAF